MDTWLAKVDTFRPRVDTFRPGVDTFGGRLNTCPPLRPMRPGRSGSGLRLVRRHCETWQVFRAIAWKRSPGIGLAGTASGSIASGESAFAGATTGRLTWRSWITTGEE